MNFISLFAGIGGIDLGLESAGFECAGQVEIEPYALKVLEKHWPDVPRYGDITKLDGSKLHGIDMLAGGFPCQDLSVAGKRTGIEGARSGLWSEFARLIGEVGPTFVLIENVSGLLIPHRYGGRVEPAGIARVLGDLARLGYVGCWFSLRASDLGASHQRKRIFIVAYRAKARCAGRENSGTDSGDALEGTRSLESKRERGELGNLAHGTPGGRGECGEPSGGGGLTDGSNAQLEHSTCAEGERFRLQREHVSWAASSTELADASRDARHGQDGEDRARRGVCEAGNELADAEHAERSAEHQEHSDAYGWLGSGRSGIAMADTSNGQLSQPGRRPEGRDKVGSASEILSDAEPEGLPDAEREELPGAQRIDEGRTIEQLCGAFAPGPSDPRWPEIIRIRPDLAPALTIDESDAIAQAEAQSEIRGVLDGVSGSLDRSGVVLGAPLSNRTKRLRALGNSVVPQCAAWIGERILQFIRDNDA